MDPSSNGTSHDSSRIARMRCSGWPTPWTGISTPPRTVANRACSSRRVGRTFVAMARRTSSEARTGHTTALPNVPYDGGSVAWLAGGAEIAIDTQATKGASTFGGDPPGSVVRHGDRLVAEPPLCGQRSERQSEIVGAVTGDVIGDLGGSWYASRIYGSVTHR